MKKMIILRKIQKKMKTFAPQFFSRLCLSLNKKASGNERHDKETQHIHASAADLLHIRIGNLALVQMPTLQK